MGENKSYELNPFFVKIVNRVFYINSKEFNLQKISKAENIPRLT